jgi:6-phosphogluconolactonase
LNPFYLSGDPAGTYLFAPNSGASSVGVYSVATGTGIISQVVGSPFPTGAEPLSVTIAPDGRFAYVASHTSSAVYGFSISRPAGILTQLAGSPWPTPLGPVTIALVTVAAPYTATIQQPINSDETSTFSGKRGVVPVKFTLAYNQSPTCNLPPATISLASVSNTVLQPIDESVYLMSADSGSSFRITGCQYSYNLSIASLESGTYEVEISVGGQVAGEARFSIK